MAENTFTPKDVTTEFIVQNVAASRKTIKIFGLPIRWRESYDLLLLPQISESYIRHSLLKGELKRKADAREIIITSCNIDLTQYNSQQRTFLASLGVTGGLGSETGGINPDALQAYYVGKHGSDTNTGKSYDQAFLTFGAATASINAEIPAPAPNNRFSIICDDSGMYAENIIVPPHADVFAPHATLQSVGANRVLQIWDDSRVEFHHVINDTGGNSTVVRNGSTGTSHVYIDMVTNGPAGNPVALANFSVAPDSVVIVKIGTIFVEGGKGVATNPNGHTHLEIEDLYLVGDNTVGVERSVAGQTLGRITHIIKLGSPTGTVGINALGGMIGLEVNTIDADTAWNVAAGGQLDLFVGSVTGSRTEIGPTRVTEPGAVPQASVQTAQITLVGGTATESTLNYTSSSVVVPVRNVELGTVGDLSVGTVTPGTPGSAVINSASGADTSTVTVLVIG